MLNTIIARIGLATEDQRKPVKRNFISSERKFNAKSELRTVVLGFQRAVNCTGQSQDRFGKVKEIPIGRLIILMAIPSVYLYQEN